MRWFFRTCPYGSIFYILYIRLIETLWPLTSSEDCALWLDGVGGKLLFFSPTNNPIEKYNNQSWQQNTHVQKATVVPPVVVRHTSRWKHLRIAAAQNRDVLQMLLSVSKQVVSWLRSNKPLHRHAINNNNNKLNTAMCFLTSRCRYNLHAGPSRACSSTSHRSKRHKTPEVISVFILVTLPFHWLKVHGRSSEPQVSLEQKKKMFQAS